MCDGTRKNIQRLPTLLFVLVGLCFAYLACGCVSARYALAEDGSGGGSFDYAVVYGPNSAAGLSDMDDPRYLVQVYASNNFDAALLALGYNPTSSSFTDDARAYLSNQSTGGAFYDFAQLFTNNNTDWGEEITSTPSLTPGINFDVTNMETALKLNNSIYGADNVWSAEYTTSQRVAAVTAVGLVLSGSVGGGSGGTVQPDEGLDGWYSVELSANCIPWSGNQANSKVSVYGISTINLDETTGKGTVSTTGQVERQITYNDTSVIKLYIDPYSYNYIRDNGYEYVSYVRSFSSTYVMTQQGAFDYIRDTGSNDSNYNLHDLSGAANKGQEFVSSSYRLCVYNGEVCAFMTQAYKYGNSYTVSANGIYNVPLKPFWNNYNGEVNNPSNPVPPTNWPDPPESPTVDPPSVPQPPTDDPVQQPTDTPIQPPNVWMPIAGTTDPTFTVDLQGVLDAMATHCKHIRDNLDANFSQLYNNMTDYWSRKYTNFKQFLDGQFGYVGETIVDKTDDLMEYLEDLFEWLAEQFDFSVSGTGYNDNTVVSWLRKIYARLGGGTTIRPPDPVVDPKGTGDWLNQLLQNLVLDLLALGRNVLADLVESFRELITKFPFSIPWDIAAILALLVAEPQAPVLEVPQYTYTGTAIQQVGTYRIDLSEWNSVMDVVRPMETILFAGWLAFKTDFFKGLLEMTKG